MKNYIYIYIYKADTHVNERTDCVQNWNTTKKIRY